MPMFVQFGQVLGGGVAVQLLNRVLVIVFGFLARSVNVAMRVLVQVGVLVGVRVLCAVCVRVLVSVDVGMHVRVRMFVLDWSRHGVFLLPNGRERSFRPVSLSFGSAATQIRCGIVCHVPASGQPLLAAGVA